MKEKMIDEVTLKELEVFFDNDKTRDYVVISKDFKEDENIQIVRFFCVNHTNKDVSQILIGRNAELNTILVNVSSISENSYFSGEITNFETLNLSKGVAGVFVCEEPDDCEKFIIVHYMPTTFDENGDVIIDPEGIERAMVIVPNDIFWE